MVILIDFYIIQFTIHQPAFAAPGTSPEFMYNEVFIQVHYNQSGFVYQGTVAHSSKFKHTS